MISSQLDQSARISVADYDPSYIIGTVNALHPLGKDEALSQIDSYLRGPGKTNLCQGLFWVLRVLFEPPEGQSFPPVYIGQFNIPDPPHPAKLPRFPIVMLRDVPFLVVNNLVLGGKAEPVATHVAYFREHGTIRAKPLAPPERLDDIDEEFLQLWKANYGDAYADEALATIRTQVARLETAKE